MIPFKSLGANARYPGVTGITWMAGLEWAAPGDIVEIRWGVAGTRLDRGRVSIGTIAGLDISEGVGDRGRFRRGQMMFWSGWYEETLNSVIYDESLMLVPDVREMPFAQTFDLRTDDVGNEAWQLVIVGHDCEGHNFGNGIEPCTSQYKPKADGYLVEHPEVSTATGE